MATSRLSLGARLPSRQQVLPVFATILFFVFTWALYRLAWQVPSWLYYLDLPGILVIVAYALAFALLESGLVLAFLLALALVLPARLFRRQFTAQGSALAILMAAGAVLLQRRIGLLLKADLQTLTVGPVLALAGLLLAILVLAVLIERFPPLARLLEALAERMTVFLYFYLPLSLLSVGVVLVRNLF